MTVGFVNTSAVQIFKIRIESNS